jgi:hypothetical protein
MDTEQQTAMNTEQAPVEVDLPDMPNDDIPEESETPTPNDSFDPPSRIASRFARATAAGRRKSSAASSRRNSLSSTHSVQSNSSYGAACRSNHVAQYLRRASILEGRKARLAAREAHAEQVRLRAALAKSAPRGSNSEERALAARVAREKKLAQVAAACAEEVRRAKRVAEEMKERRAAEEERYRVEMEGKLAEAERRRAEYKRGRRPRTASASAASPGKAPRPKPVDRESAVRCIQRAWRRRRRRVVFDNFVALGLSIDKVTVASFGDVSSLLCDDDILATTTRVLELLGVQICEKELDPQATTRTFLTAYLILGHPNDVLSSGGEQEQDLMQKAKELIINFEQILSKPMSPPATLVQAFSYAHSAYVTAFADWKAEDRTLVVDLLVQDFVNLDAIWQSVKDDTAGGVADDYRDAIRENQVRLLARLQKLAGQDRANGLIRRAIRLSRQQRRIQKRKPTTGVDARPRPAAELATPVEGPELAQAAPQSDRVQVKNISAYFSVMPSNRVLTHELAIDKDYRVDAGPSTRLRDEMHRKICASMREAFERGHGDQWTVATAENVRTKLLQLLVGSNGHGSMYQLISETLDPELIARQCAQGVFSYRSFFAFMATVLPKLCAPVRDPEVKALAEDLQAYGSLDEMIEKLFRVFHMIDVLALDYSNFLLANVAPRLVRSAPTYEQACFRKDVEEGRVTLVRTRRWWNNATVNALTDASSSSSAAAVASTGAPAGRRPTMAQIYARGLADLALAPAPLADDDVPETLELDRARIAAARDAAARIAVVGAVLLGAKNLLKRDVRQPWRAEAARMLEILRGAGFGVGEAGASSAAASPSSGPAASSSASSSASSAAAPAAAGADAAARLLAALESAHALPPATRATLASTIARLLGHSGSSGGGGGASRLSTADPVARLLHARLKAHVLARLAAAQDSERARAKAAGGAGASLAGAGLTEFAAEVGALVDGLGRVAELDRLSHGVWYEEIAGEGAAAAAETSAQLEASSSSAAEDGAAKPVEEKRPA